MADKTYDILIDIRAQLQGLQDATKEIGNARAEAEGFNNAFKIGGAVEIIRLISEQLQEIPRLLEDAVKSGVEFNKLMEQSRVGIAGVLKLFDPKDYKDFNSALGDSDKLIALLIDKSNKLGISFEAMLETYRTTAGALFSGGVRDLQKQVDLTVLLTQAMAAFGITGFRAQRDIFDLLEGRASRTLAGQALSQLGITDASIANAKEAGTLYELLTTKLQATAEAGAAMGDTFAAAEQRAKNLVQQLEGIATKDFFGQLKKGLDDFNTSLADEKTAEAARGWGLFFANLAYEAGIAAKALAETVRWYVIIQSLGAAGVPSTEGSVFDVGAAAQLVDHETKILETLKAQIVAATTAALETKARKDLDQAILDLQKLSAASTGETRIQADKLLVSFQEIDRIFPEIVASADKFAKATGISADKLAAMVKVAAVLQPLADKLRSTQLDAAGDTKGAFDFETQLQINEARAAALKADPGNLVAAEEAELVVAKKRTIEYQQQTDALNEHKRLDDLKLAGQKLILAGDKTHGEQMVQEAAIETKALQIQKEYGVSYDEAYARAKDTLDTEKGIADQKKGQKDTQKELNLLLREESDLIKDIRVQQKLVSESPFLSVDAKQIQLSALFISEQQELAKQIQVVQDALTKAYGSGNQEEVEKLKEKLRELQTTATELGFKISTMDFIGGLRSDLTTWVNSFGTAAHQVASIITGTLNTAIAQTSQAITGLIFGTLTWKQAFASAAQSIVQDVIKILLQWIISRTVMSALNAIFGKIDASASSKLAESAAASWSAAAVSASIATEGVAAGTGLAAYIAAIGSGMAAASGFAAGGSAAGGGFKSGGFTGVGAPDQIAGIVHAGEFVFSKAATENIGLRTLYALMQAPVFGVGGFVNPLHRGTPMAGFGAGGYVQTWPDWQYGVGRGENERMWRGTSTATLPGGPGGIEDGGLFPGDNPVNAGSPGDYDSSLYHDYFPGDPRYGGGVNPYAPLVQDPNTGLWTRSDPGMGQLPPSIQIDPGAGATDNASGNAGFLGSPVDRGASGGLTFDPVTGQFARSPGAGGTIGGGGLEDWNQGYGRSPSSAEDLSLMNRMSAGGDPNNMRGTADEGHTRFNLWRAGQIGRDAGFHGMVQDGILSHLANALVSNLRISVASPSGGFEAGGDPSVGGAAGGGLGLKPQVNVHHALFFDLNDARNHLLNSSEGDKVLTDVFNRISMQLGFRR